MTRWTFAILLVSALAFTRPLTSQTAYYSLDTGRPTRVDDATPTERYALEVMLAPVRAEAYPRGLTRLRFEPKLSYGILPRTELEVRAPFVRVRAPGATAQTGVTSIGIGASHELTLEGRRIPALAVGGEWLAAAGRMSPPGSSYSARAMATKTFSFFRVHLNGAWGSYSVQPTSSAADCKPLPRQSVFFPVPGVVYCTDTSSVRVPVDIPCGAVPAEVDDSHEVSAAVADPSLTPSKGRRTFLGLAIDHAFARQSTLVIADITTERFLGLYPGADLTVELGARHQLNPWLVLDAGIGRKMHGSAQFTAVTVGATLDLPGTPELCSS